MQAAAKRGVLIRGQEFLPLPFEMHDAAGQNLGFRKLIAQTCGHCADFLANNGHFVSLSFPGNVACESVKR